MSDNYTMISWNAINVHKLVGIEDKKEECGCIVLIFELIEDQKECEDTPKEARMPIEVSEKKEARLRRLIGKQFRLGVNMYHHRD